MRSPTGLADPIEDKALVVEIEQTWPMPLAGISGTQRREAG
jgi:hypothetical protein